MKTFIIKITFFIASTFYALIPITINFKYFSYLAFHSLFLLGFDYIVCIFEIIRNQD